VPADALSRVRQAVYKQYANKSIPTLHTTLNYLTAEGAAGLPAGKFKWRRTTFFQCMQDMGASFSRAPYHNDVAREIPAIVAQRNQLLR